MSSARAANARIRASVPGMPNDGSASAAVPAIAATDAGNSASSTIECRTRLTPRPLAQLDSRQVSPGEDHERP